METTRQTGGCQCGAVRYLARGELGYPHICHCRMCQKAAGNYFLPLAAAKRDHFELTRGEPKWFHSSDLVRRGFAAIAARRCSTIFRKRTSSTSPSAHLMSPMRSGR